MKYIALLLTVFLLAGCSIKDQGKALGTAWVTHNSAVRTATVLGEEGILDLSDLEEFASYQGPVKESLDSATDLYVTGDYESTQLYLELTYPLLERMVEIVQENEDE